MAFCSKCGTQVTEGATFCQNCGQSGSPAARQGGGVDSGLSENAAATLSYALGWLTGLVFLLIDKRPYVRFHAAQSLVLFAGLHIVRIILGMVFGISFLGGGMMGWTGFSFGLGIFHLLGLAGLVLWILCMVKAFQGEKFVLPIVGDIAQGIAGR
jgi:uncharacterized membrane protein